MEVVNVRGESEDNGGRQIIEKRRPSPCIMTLPPSKTCTTSTRLNSLRVSIVEDDTTTGVLREGTVCDDMSWVITEGTELVWTIAGGVAKAAAKRTVVAQAMVLGMAQGALLTIRTFIFRTVDTKMPKGMAVKTNSLRSHCHGWAQMGVSRDNLSRVGHGVALVESRSTVSRDVLRGLRNLISSSAHSSVVRGHIELESLGPFASGDEKSMRLKSH